MMSSALPLAQAAPAIPMILLAPEILLATAGCAVLLLAQAQRDTVRRLVPWITLLAIAAAVLLVRALPWLSGSTGAELGSAGSGLRFDSLADFARTSTLVLGIIITLACWAQPPAGERGEFFSMLLFSLSGLLLLGPANDLLMLFLALELVSIPTYVMVVLSRTEPKSLEGGTKYFYLGALAAAITAYGLSLIYGVSGTSSLSGSAAAVTQALSNPGTISYAIASAGVVLTIGGLLFKLAAVPLHLYVADVYEGAGSPVAGMLGFVPKLAGLVGIFRVIGLTGFWDGRGADLSMFWLLWIIAVASMTVGNFLAVRQSNVKRMLAYSGVAHAGYMLVGILAGPKGGAGFLGDGAAAVLYYVVIYGIANLAAFALLGTLRVRGEPCETYADLAGLGRRFPALALLMALAMFTLMGMPPTPGFWGKLSLFGSALSASSVSGLPPSYEPWIVALVIIAVVNSAVGAAYYLRVIAAVLLQDREEPIDAGPSEAPQMSVMLCGFLMLIFAFYPQALLSAGRSATSDLRAAAVLPAPREVAALPPHPVVITGTE